MTGPSGAAQLERITLRAAGRDVPLLAGPQALAQLPEALRAAGFHGRLWLVADRNALRIHGSALGSLLPAIPTLELSGAEADKTLQQVSVVWDWLVEQGAERRDALVAFGGGVICDLVGFAAASYLRGIALVNVPTTLLAQVDASVGGKTGVNHPRGKNLIGAFHQPIAVVADTTFLSTLPPREFAGGMAEIAKIAMVLDENLFVELANNAPTYSPANSDSMAPIIARAIELKAMIVERDEREAGDRMLLNYGHTIGHAIEAAAGFGALLHGEAVSIGMTAAAKIAVDMGFLDPSLAKRQQKLLRDLNLPEQAPGVDPADVVSRLRLDKKREADRQRWILPDRIGHAQIREDVPAELVRNAAELVTNPRVVSASPSAPRL